jgi:hypothetical protein
MYTKIDLHETYNLVHIEKGDEWKMMFKMRYGHFEYVVMPFGLTNAPAIFQHLMNDNFCEYLDDFVVCCINDIFILLMNMEDHECHVCLVLEKL